jgi:hypothetical protein
VRLQGDPIPIPSKNFLATHQLDIDCWTELLCTTKRLWKPRWRVCRKRAVCVHLSSMAPTMRRRSGGCRASAPGHCSAQGLLRYTALHLHSLGRALCNKLKNGSLNYADWRSLLPDNAL